MAKNISAKLKGPPEKDTPNEVKKCTLGAVKCTITKDVSAKVAGGESCSKANGNNSKNGSKTKMCSGGKSTSMKKKKSISPADRHGPSRKASKEKPGGGGVVDALAGGGVDGGEKHKKKKKSSSSHGKKKRHSSGGGHGHHHHRSGSVSSHKAKPMVFINVEKLQIIEPAVAKPSPVLDAPAPSPQEADNLPPAPISPPIGSVPSMPKSPPAVSKASMKLPDNDGPLPSKAPGSPPPKTSLD